MPGLITSYEITDNEQLQDPVIRQWAEDKLKEAVAEVAVSSIRLTDIWGSNTIVFRDSHATARVGYLLARLGVTQLAGVGISGINGNNLVQLVVYDTDNPPNMIGAVRMKTETPTGSGDVAFGGAVGLSSI